jgi:hypothetical protein
MIYQVAMRAKESKEVELIGREAAYLSAVEIGLGSLLHSLHVPFTGYFLSLNQGFFLSRAIAQGRELPRARLIPASISSIAALLKSLSPSGKKLTPMLAISMQGLWFCAGTLLFGATLAGAVVGSVLCGLWAFVQPLLLFSVLYGKDLARIAAFYEEKFHVLWLLWALVGLKAALSAGLAVAGWMMPEARFARYRERLVAVARGRGARGPGARGAPVVGVGAMSVAGSAVGGADRDAADALGGGIMGVTGDEAMRGTSGAMSAAGGAARDLLNPLFLVSLALTAGFFRFAEAGFAEIAWQLLRPVAVGFVIFFLVRVISMEGLVARLERSRWRGLAGALGTALWAVRGNARG